MDIFFRSKGELTLSVCALMGLLTNSLNYDWSMFSRVLPSLDRVKMRDNLFVTVGLAVMIFRAAFILHFKIVAVWSLKRLTDRIFRSNN
jgi:hypothetical protein